MERKILFIRWHHTRTSRSNVGQSPTTSRISPGFICGALTAIYNDSQDMRFYPPQLLRRKVKAGHLGRKTGKGWYTYDENGNRK